MACYVSFSASGTLQFQIATGSATQQWLLQPGSMLTIKPI
jgi:hypothetical protein